MSLFAAALGLSSLPTIDVPPAAPPPGADSVLMVLSWIFWIAGVAGIAGIIFVAITMFFAHRQGHGAPEFVAKLGVVIIALILVASASGIVSLFLGF